MGPLVMVVLLFALEKSPAKCIALVSLSMYCFYSMTGQQCDITGWGSLNDNSVKPTTLQVTRLPIVKTEECQKFYDIKITESMLCAGYANRGIGACFGDSGGI